MPISWGRKSEPAGMTTLPLRMFSPRMRTCEPALTAEVRRIHSPSSSTSSIGTTVPQPGGTGAPVIILTASPGCTRSVRTSPAGRKPVTFRRLPLRAAWENAKPSMAELSAGGMSHGAMCASGVTLLSPWNRRTFSVSSGVISLSMVRCASSMLTIEKFPLFLFRSLDR